MRILAIESTCDETAAAVVEKCGDGIKVLSSVVASSAEIHQKYGGVVPEVAAREQVRSVIPVVNEAMEGIKKEEIDAIAVSFGPGLMGSLLVGIETAKVLSAAWKKPLLKVNHMAAHVAANWIVNNENDRIPTLPAVGLVVSGGHTDLILMKSVSEWEWIGGTRDDASGEAFDKAARILGLPYPGGPSIQKVVDELMNIEDRKFILPRPMYHEDNLEMSFSGLKAALSKIISNGNLSEMDIKLLAKEFNESVVDVLVKKTLSARDKYDVNSVLLAGGVAANKLLRTRFTKEIEPEYLFIPEFKYCGDNAAMVGAAAVLSPSQIDPSELRPEPGLTTV